MPAWLSSRPAIHSEAFPATGSHAEQAGVVAGYLIYMLDPAL